MQSFDCLLLFRCHPASKLSECTNAHLKLMHRFHLIWNNVIAYEMKTNTGWKIYWRHLMLQNSAFLYMRFLFFTFLEIFPQQPVSHSLSFHIRWNLWLMLWTMSAWFPARTALFILRKPSQVSRDLRWARAGSRLTGLARLLYKHKKKNSISNAMLYLLWRWDLSKAG